MKRLVFFGLLVPAVASFGLLYGCWSDAEPRVVAAGDDATFEDGPHGDLSDGATSNGDGAPLNDAGACTGVDPKDSPACLADEYGVFVNGTAKSGGGSGTREDPFTTIGAAITKAIATTGRVYICAGTYKENVTLSASVALYGGWSCDQWAYDSTNDALIQGAANSPALSITASRVTLEDLEFDSPDAVGATSGNGNSSVAAFVTGAQDVAFTRCSFSAGAGAAGSPGDADGGMYTAPATLGNPGTSAAGGAQLGPTTCANGSGTTTGGGGAAPFGAGANGFSGGSTPPVADASSHGAGGNSTVCAGGNGGPGAGGIAGVAATVAGTLGAGGWVGSPGGSGGIGSVGQGGGGGASTDTTGGGGSGGAGGCGGTGGAGGVAGGASIGIAIVASTVTVTSSSISAKNGGIGGSGSAGEAGQAGGSPGGTASGTNACQGGRGGPGGAGGGGAGGTGGASLGIVWTGTAPTLDGAPLATGASPNGITIAATAALGGTHGAAGLAASQASANGGTEGHDGNPGPLAAALGL